MGANIVGKAVNAVNDIGLKAGTATLTKIAGKEASEEVMLNAAKKANIVTQATKGAIYGVAGGAVVGGVMNIDDGFSEFSKGTLGGAGLGTIGGAGAGAVAAAIAHGIR